MLEKTGMFICEVCGKEHDGTYGSGRFCSISCSQSYTKKESKCEYCNEVFPSNKELRKHYPNCSKKNHKIGYKLGKNYTWICPVCNDILETRRKLASHKKEHSNDELLASYNKSINIKGDFYCEFCGRHSTTKSGNKLHERYCSQNPYGEVFIGHPVDTSTRKKISQTCSENKKSGGYREGSGIGKSGWYKRYWCDSSWELAYVIYNLEHNISFRRNTERFPYMYNGKELYYIPDFIEGDTYIEIKGYHSEQVDAKIKYFPYNLKVFYKVEMEKYISYVEEKYGKNYISLYETNNTN